MDSAMGKESKEDRKQTGEKQPRQRLRHLANMGKGKNSNFGQNG